MSGVVSIAKDVGRMVSRAFSRPGDVSGHPAYFDGDAMGPEESWPPESERPRLYEYERGYKLFQGNHKELFDPQRDLQREGPYVVVNVCYAASQTLTDFLVLVPPVVSVAGQSSVEPIEGIGAPLDPILWATKWPTFLQKAVNSGSYNGDLIMKVVWSAVDGVPKLVNIPPSRYFPVFNQEDNSIVDVALLAWIVERWGDNDEYALLREEWHWPGFVGTRWYRMKRDLSSGGDGLVEKWKRELISVDEPKKTGIDVIPIVHVANGPIVESEPWGQNDYQRANELQATLNAIASGNRHIIRKWTDPKLAVDESYFDENNNCNLAMKEAFKLVQDEPAPHYISIPLENYDHSDNEAAMTIKRMLMVMGISPPTVGIADDAPLPQSGRALLVGEGLTRRTGSRKRIPLDAGLRTALSIASKFWASRAPQSAPAVLGPHDISMEWSEGFPKSDRDRDDEMVLLKSTEALANYDLLKMRFPNYKETEIQEMLARKKKQDEEQAELTAQATAAKMQNDDNPAADAAEKSTTAKTTRRKVESGG